MSARVAPRAAPASASLWSSISFCAIAAASASVRNLDMARLFQLWCRFTRRDLLERFQAKWLPVRVKKTRKNNTLEPRSDLIGSEKALVIVFTVFSRKAG